MIRDQFYDVHGRRITLFGTFAFSYTIEIQWGTLYTINEIFPNGASARKRYSQLKRKR